jgi:hypothetical protein
MLHDSMPSLSAVHNQSVIEDSDEHLTDQQLSSNRKKPTKFPSPAKVMPNNGPKRATMIIDTFTPLNRDET